jgi:hypothetical protein
MKLNITLCAFVILFLCSQAFPVDIYLSKLQGFYTSRSDSESLNRKVDFISNQLKKELMNQSSDIITYDDLGGLAQRQRREYNAEPITDTLDALAVCFFYNIEYVLFGELYINSDTNQYRAEIKLYSKASGDITHTIEYSKVAENDISFSSGLATTINQELMVKIAGISGEKEQGDETTDEERLLDTVREELDKSDEDDRTARDDRRDDRRDDDRYTRDDGKEKVFGLYASLGYFIQFTGEWVGVVLPCATMEEGVQWALPVVDKENFDFYIRPALLFNYSFSVQDPFNTYHIYVHYHSLAVKGNVDFFFEYSDFFGFFVGLGPQFKIDIIDFRTRSADFYTDIPYAFGVCGNAGVEFALNKPGTFRLGVNNVFDFTFYDATYIDYKILIYSIFRI